MILYENTVVKYRDGTVKTLDEVGGEAKELAPDTPVKSGSGSSKPLDEFIQDQIVLSPDTVVVDGEDTTTLEDFIEEEIDGNTGVVHKTGTEEITGKKTFKDEVRVNTATLLTNMLTKYEGDGIETNAEEFTVTGQEKLTLDSDVDVYGDLEITGKLAVGDKLFKRIAKTDIPPLTIGATGFGQILTFPQISGYTPVLSVINNWSDAYDVPYGSGIYIDPNTDTINIWIFGPKNGTVANLAVTLYYVQSDLLETVIPT